MFVIDYGCENECAEYFQYLHLVFAEICAQKSISTLTEYPAFAVDVTCYPKCRNLQNQNKSVE